MPSCLLQSNWKQDKTNLYFRHPTFEVHTYLELILTSTDYGRPMKPFFIEIPNFWAWADKFGQINYAACGVFLVNLSAPILVLWVPCPCFPLIDHYFYIKLILCIQIPNIYLGLGFEFGPQRIRDLAIVCPQSVKISINVAILPPTRYVLDIKIDCHTYICSNNVQ